MKNRRGISGFTMAEMLIVVAIIAVLGGVGFVAVQNYQRSMAQLECDAIAKEIFVAAQNHLTMAESQGYLGLDSTSYGNEGTWSDDQDVFNRQQVYYFTVNGSSSFRDYPMLNMVLPFGSIDETVRIGGSYIIRYQPNPARVLDVFYCSATDPRFKHRLTESDYKTLLNIVYDENGDNKDDRKEYGNSKAVVGWFGGEDVLITGDYDIIAPEISVENAERLTVTVTNKNAPAAGVSIKLIVSSKNIRDNNDYAKIAFDLIASTPRVSGPTDGKYTIVLDSITAPNEHFAKLNDLMPPLANKFISGEDIVVQAVAYSNSRLSNIAYSAEITVNSLFADLIDVVNESTDDSESDNSDGEAPEFAALFSADGTSVKSSSLTMEETSANKTAVITHFRHLENLDAEVSSVDYEALDITQAKQVSDLDWNSFILDLGKDVQILKPDGDPFTGLLKGCYKPVNANYLTLYDGGYTATDESDNPRNVSHSITGIKVEYDGNSGLFGTFGFDPDDGAEPAKITNLELVDFEITSTGGNAGALAGTLNHTTVSNVLAYHKNDSATISATNGDAGGLVGNMTGGKIEQCAAALYVQGKANAGGLVGSAKDANITASYSGGHTDGHAKYARDHYNVTASDGLAGGLVGYASNTKINSCYSTCSASGTTAAGGLIGSVDNATGKTVTVNYCYAAGLVKSDAHAGTFLGQPDPEDPKELATGSANNHYVSGINGTMESGCNATVLPAVVEANSPELCKPANDKQKYAVPFDTKIIMKKRDSELHPRYTYLTIQQICDVSKPKDADNADIVLVSSDFIIKHYGDWQEPVDLDANAQLSLDNAEKLTAKVSLPVEELDEGQMLTMMVKGKTSDQYAYLVMSLDENATDNTYDVALKATSSIKGVEIENWLDNIIVKAADIGANKNFEFDINLDSITDAGGHFAQLFPAFIPGEDIIVAIRGNEVSAFEMQAVIAATVDDPLKKETNSLFASVNSEKTASIKNFRHLENLDKVISGLGQNNNEMRKVTITTAVQLNDMNWITDWSGGWKDATIYLLSDGKPLGEDEHFIPVDLNYPLDYLGNSKVISNLVVNHKGHAGLFGSMVDGSSVSNLELIDFSVIGTGDAGALAGTLAGTNVTNVLAHNSTNATTVNVSATSGNAGGLIGSMTGGTVKKSAAAVIVSAGDDTHVGNAGGLIGTVSNGTIVNASYSGGHTENAAYSSTNYNVTATGTAGGLIGDAGGATISNSYSTCSATGATVGGFVGTSSGTIANCYATGLVSGTTTGLVSGTTKGAFAGSLNNATNCWYYEIINEGIPALPGKSAIVINAIDYDTASYNRFVSAPVTWNQAEPYDSTLKTNFENKFNLRTVDQLASIDKKELATGTDFVVKHYGDWPAPEMLVVNK